MCYKIYKVFIYYKHIHVLCLCVFTCVRTLKIESMVDVRLITIEADQKGDLTTYNVYFTSCLTKQKQTS